MRKEAEAGVMAIAGRPPRQEMWHLEELKKRRKRIFPWSLQRELSPVLAQ